MNPAGVRSANADAQARACAVFGLGGGGRAREARDGRRQHVAVEGFDQAGAGAKSTGLCFVNYEFGLRREENS